MQKELYKTNSIKENELVISLRIKKKLVTLVDADREKYSASRTTWVVLAIIERLERMGYEIE